MEAHGVVQMVVVDLAGQMAPVTDAAASSPTYGAPKQ